MRTSVGLVQLFLLFSLPMCATTGSAQVPTEWQSISKEDLALKDNPASPGSAALILDRQVYTDDEKRFQTEFVRIKVLTEEGRANAAGPMQM